MSIANKNQGKQTLTGEAAERYYNQIGELWKNDISNGYYNPTLDILIPIPYDKTGVYQATFVLRFSSFENDELLGMELLPYPNCTLTQNIREGELKKIQKSLLSNVFTLKDIFWPSDVSTSKHTRGK